MRIDRWPYNRWATTILLVLMGIAQSSYGSEEKWYQIEYIVFENSRPIFNREDPRDNTQPPDFLNSYPQIPNLISEGSDEAILGLFFPVPIPFQQLKPSDRLLKEAYEKLSNAAAYRPVFHSGWRQPPIPVEESKPVRIRPTQEAEAERQAFWEALGGASLAELMRDNKRLRNEERAVDTDKRSSTWETDGLLRVSIARYIHVELDLLFRELGALPEPAEPNPGDATDSVADNLDPISPPTVNTTAAQENSTPPLGLQHTLEQVGEDATPASETDGDPEAPIEEIAAPPQKQPVLAQFRLREKRRIRSGELHYFDHPRFGLILQVTPIKVTIPESSSSVAG